MSSIQRWDVYVDGNEEWWTRKDEFGEFVKFDDHVAIVTRLESRLAAAEKVIAVVRRQVESPERADEHVILAALDEYAAKETA